MKPLVRVKKEVTGAWTELRARMQTISSISLVRPVEPEEVFTFTHDKDYGKIIATVRPVTFNVPYRANAATAKIFVAIDGWIEFSDDDTSGSLRSLRFQTNVGYFRDGGPNTLQYLCGIHYDYDSYDAIGHPVYHCQFGPQVRFFDEVNACFHRAFSEPSDDLKAIPRQIRIPTAQMDPFSVFLQVCSDHLISEGSDANKLAAYASLLKTCGFFTCSSNGIAQLGAAFAESNLRSHHWYNDGTAMV